MRFNKKQLAESWNTYSLNDICLNITSGGTPSRKNSEFYQNGDIYWVKTKELNNSYILDTEEKITQEALKNSSAKLLPQNTILLAMYGATVGELGILSKEMSCNQACCALIVNPEIANYKFVYYLLKLYKEEIKSLATGAAQQNLSTKVIKDFEFDLPSLSKQDQIVGVLSYLDDKIQLNTQINQTLEQIAQAIFKSWFIDFDPVRAKAAAKAQGETDDQAEQAAMSIISGKSPAELTAYRQTHPHDYQKLAQLARHFPSEFEVIDGVEVPKGWGRVSIADKNVLEIIKPKINSFQGEKEYIATANVSGNSIVGDLELISYDNRPSRANMQPIANSIWFAKMVGEHKAILIDENDKFLIEETILSTGFMGLKPKKNKKCFLYCYINSEFFLNEKNQLATGAVQIALNNGSFSRIEITLPSDEVLEKFEQKLEKIFSLISENQKENKILAKSRDLLLPKLLNGEI